MTSFNLGSHDLAPVGDCVHRQPHRCEEEAPYAGEEAQVLGVDGLLVEREDSLAQRVLQRVEERAHKGQRDADHDELRLL